MVLDLAEQLIAQAEDLLHQGFPNEASVRRAVSTSYYSLFHLLVRDAIANWREAEDHPRLARVFEHKQMRAASIALASDLTKGKTEPSEVALELVVRTFVDLQNARHKADYDTAEPFDSREAAVLVAQSRTAFDAWHAVRNQPVAQRYLYSLLFRDKT